MDKAVAWARLKAMTAADSEPVLTGDELEALLAMASIADSEDYAPTEDDWTPTYDLNRAAAEGWRWKMAKIVGRFDFSADGASYSRSQFVAHCQEMINNYRRKVVGSARLTAPVALADTSEEDDDEELI